MPAFHIMLHARPANLRPGLPTDVDGVTIATWELDSVTPSARWDSGFEAAAAKLASIPRLFLEMDGSFVCVGNGHDGDSCADRWQLEGQLYDRDHHLVFVELKGSCPERIFDEVLAAIDPGPNGVLVQLARQAVFVSCEQFRILAFP